MSLVLNNWAQDVLPLKLLQICKPVLCYSVIRWSFPFQNNPKDLDPPYKNLQNYVTYIFQAIFEGGGDYYLLPNLESTCIQLGFLDKIFL